MKRWCGRSKSEWKITKRDSWKSVENKDKLFCHFTKKFLTKNCSRQSFSSFKVIAKTRPKFLIWPNKVKVFELWLSFFNSDDLTISTGYLHLVYYHYCRQLPIASDRVSPMRIYLDTLAYNRLFYWLHSELRLAA